MNNCTFLGRITKDIELKHSASNVAIANFTLAVNRDFKKEGQPDADFITMVAIGKSAETIQKFCEKGSQIAVTSRVQVRNWDDKEGKKHYTTEFVVDRFSFAGGKSTKPANSKPTSSEDDDFEL